MRTLGYALTSDGYDGEDISILATHLFDGRQLVAWDYCSSANLIWFVFADGGAVALTFYQRTATGRLYPLYYRGVVRKYLFG